MCPNDNVKKSVAARPQVAVDTKKTKVDTKKTKEEAEEAVDAPLATISEVFSFAEHARAGCIWFWDSFGP